MYKRQRLQRGQAPATEVGHRLVTTIHPAVSGDVVVVLDPCCLVSEGKYATSHGQPYVYDSAVPLLLAGYGIKPGVSHARVSPLDIAPTLAALAGVLAPATCEGKVLECVATGR